MREYLVNVGEFNIIVLPDRRQYFIIGDGPQGAEIQDRFTACQAIPYDAMTAHWFQYGADETWKDFKKKEYRLGQDLSEDELIDLYVLKKFNFGSLVAVRDSEGGKVRLFKRGMLRTS